MELESQAEQTSWPDNDERTIATVFPDDNKKYITTKLSEPVDDNPELISNKINLIGFEVI